MTTEEATARFYAAVTTVDVVPFKDLPEPIVEHDKDIIFIDSDGQQRSLGSVRISYIPIKKYLAKNSLHDLFSMFPNMKMHGAALLKFLFDIFYKKLTEDAGNSELTMSVSLSSTDVFGTETLYQLTTAEMLQTAEVATA